MWTAATRASVLIGALLCWMGLHDWYRYVVFGGTDNSVKTCQRLNCKKTVYYNEDMGD